MTEASTLGVGRALAEARRAQGLALEDISQQLKFMPRQLEALEAERFEMLPGPTIARGMVRTYAKFLKLDPEPLLKLMIGHVETRDATPQLAARFQQPVPFADSGRRSTVVYLVLSAFVLAGGGAVLYEWRHERAAPEFVAAAEIGQQAARPAPVEPPRPAGEQIASNAPVALPSLPTPAPAKPAETPKPAAAKSVEPAKPAAPQIKLAERSSEPKSISGINRIVFRFDADAWLEVTDGAGRQIVSSLNPAGSERVVRGTPPFSLVIGNANHVKLRYNDREVDLQPHVRVEVARFTLK